MLKYTSKYLYCNDFNYGENECIRDNAVNTASSSSKRHSIDFQDSEIFYRSWCPKFTSHIIVVDEIFYII